MEIIFFQFNQTFFEYIFNFYTRRRFFKDLYLKVMNQSDHVTKLYINSLLNPNLMSEFQNSECWIQYIGLEIFLSIFYLISLVLNLY